MTVSKPSSSRTITDRSSEISTGTEDATKRGVSEEKYRERISSALWGTPKMMVERLRQYLSRGVSHIILMLPRGEELDQIKLIGQEVLSRLQSKKSIPPVEMWWSTLNSPELPSMVTLGGRARLGSGTSWMLSNPAIAPGVFSGSGTEVA